MQTYHTNIVVLDHSYTFVHKNTFMKIPSLFLMIASSLQMQTSIFQIRVLLQEREIKQWPFPDVPGDVAFCFLCG